MRSEWKKLTENSFPDKKKDGNFILVFDKLSKGIKLSVKHISWFMYPSENYLWQIIELPKGE